MEVYGKTVLNCYPLLDKVAKQIENLIKAKVRNSFYDYSDMTVQSEKILRLSEARKDLKDLEIRAKNAFEKLPEYEKVILSYKYFGVVPKSECYDFKSRNYFRKQKKAADKFTDELKKTGVTEDAFMRKYMKIAFIAGAYQKTLKEEGKKHVREV